MSVRVETHIFSPELCQELLQLPEVQLAMEKVDELTKGSIYFTIPLSTTIKESLFYRLGLDVQKTEIPMRWIKGDTIPHEDVGRTMFDDTYLVYLTDSEGEFIVNGEHFPIQSGTAYVFSEGLSHETVHTGTQPRLLLGPMSEFAEPVGISAIYGNGGTTAYLRYQSGIVEYTSDHVTWNPVYFPCGIVNSDPSLGIFTVELETDLTFTNPYEYFIPVTSDIQLGSRTLKEDGTRPRIYLDAITNYSGLVQNGTLYGNGQNNFRLYNLFIEPIHGATLDTNAGWFGQAYYGKGATSNLITNCHSNGDVTTNGGGIIGPNAADSSGSVQVIGCSSTGAITSGAGGIVGIQAGSNNGSVTCSQCFTIGLIQPSAGGIVGQGAQGVTVDRCYSTGAIQQNGGGIMGADATQSTCTACYSTGAIGTDAGGILGSNGSNSTVTNVYSTGNVQSQGGAICGSGANAITVQHAYATGSVTSGQGYIYGNSGTVPATCYSEAANAGSSWSDTHARLVLEGFPLTGGVGTTWFQTAFNQPYELRRGYTPYLRTNIDESGELVVDFHVSVQAGQSTPIAIIPNQSYLMVEIQQIVGTGGQIGVIVDPDTGAIFIQPDTTKGATFQIYLRNTGSYHFSSVIAEILDDVTCCSVPVVWTNTSPQDRCDILTGNAILGGIQRGPMSYDAYLSLLKSKASRTALF